jgi:hypothetical protein
MLSTELRPLMPKRREKVLGPTRYTIPFIAVKIHATANPRSYLYCRWQFPWPEKLRVPHSSPLLA